MRVVTPPTHVGADVAFSRDEADWRHTFLLGGGPLPATACVWLWDKGDGGRVAQSLAQGLLLPEDIHIYSDGDEESLARQLQWHTIAVKLLTLCHAL